ncbi:MAG TPA: hemerythrin domain-containing protein [Terracidiphilus sp.]|jgi:hemerythrin-like domain-containing protein|nr:hemerythrin domain-containing protein [Terracidiphilus sp.]
MGVQIGAKPDAGFEDPIGMLKDCHRRIEQFLGILCVVAERAPGRALTGEESAAVQAAVTYFHVGGVRHNADEEESLFPRMRASGDAGDLNKLEHDHRDAAGLHARVEELYADWLARGALDAEKQQELVEATKSLKRLYTEHIEREETVVFPRAARTLGADAIAEIGREFQARRA